MLYFLFFLINNDVLRDYLLSLITSYIFKGIRYLSKTIVNYFQYLKSLRSISIKIEFRTTIRIST